ncbi:helix-turn-helix transcriptional regulator [Jannaschia sp. M317]|uniref:helix-turn-helix domain-containing protein n=1 Tax=Jannaschia sp. M317 TaxID=2867011 RepID=UPI0021A6A477|nr:helix-turn-helix transcriptional regulator [Jannaschia sp. M317]UWQ16258.1 helix-turn-helix domain-containing protein [Jannaschia sp. M317]
MTLDEDSGESPRDWFHPETTTLGDRLAGAREAAGLSQPELARRLGVKVKSLRNWEADQSEPRANRVQMLSGILNVSLVWLLTGQGQGLEDPQISAEEEDSDLLQEIADLHRKAASLAERIALLETRLRARLAVDA